ncbi:unnamed protein product [Dimorphilus gyrociliatus]|uniref:ubiquitinyl hydrolase 1 n=1 Tax=Dimorphilus gyrociliatus TaxID=2664684 RepID=A0A7I8VPI9_9ANNE|nr:unnamed protein product [Dimorphilus gyrociliatus]
MKKHSARRTSYFVLTSTLDKSKGDFEVLNDEKLNIELRFLEEGEIFVLNNDQTDSIVVTRLEDINSPIYFSIVSNCLQLVTDSQCQILLPCSREGRRKLTHNIKNLQDIMKLCEGDIVTITTKYSFKKLIGKIRYRGNLKNKLGVWFGVELSLDFYGEGDTNGVGYFTCTEQLGLFVTADQISIEAKVPEFKEALNIGTRVMWPSDTGNEYGTVKWFGKLKKEPSKAWMVGVEFDRPVGSGTGAYKNEKLFTAKENHASFVPLIGLAPCSEEPVNYPTSESQLNIDKSISNKNESEKKPNNPKPDLYNNPNYDPLVEKFPKFDVGSRVKIKLKTKPIFGVIRWKGKLTSSSKKAVGIEVEDTFPGCSSGEFLGKKIFTCPPNKAFFYNEGGLFEDRRTFDNESLEWCQKYPFGKLDSPLVTDEYVPTIPLEEIDRTVVGKYRGIQGYCNSCYLDSALFSLFVFSDVFKPILCEQTSNPIQLQLKAIIATVRKYGWVRADYVYQLREELNNMSNGKLPGLLKEEQDPEEFINFLFSYVKIEPLLVINTMEKMNIFNITETENANDPPQLSELLGITFLKNDISLKTPPKGLLVQMPRSGLEKSKKYVIPDLKINITPLLINYEHKCAICDSAAKVKCKDCLKSILFADNLYDRITYCDECNKKVHSHRERTDHKSNCLDKNVEGSLSSPIYMNLKSVICISTSHYVSFVRCGKNVDDPWLFQDSMADRVSCLRDRFGFNIPWVKKFQDVGKWLNKPGKEIEESINDNLLPKHVLRILSDAYICLYELN